MRVLFVDDERDLVSSLSRYFRLHGFETAGAFGVSEAVRKLEDARLGGARFDAVVTDLRMPDGDGLVVLREVRRDSANGHFLDTRFADESESSLCKVAKPAVEQAARSAAGAESEIMLLH